MDGCKFIHQKLNTIHHNPTHVCHPLIFIAPFKLAESSTTNAHVDSSSERKPQTEPSKSRARSLLKPFEEEDKLKPRSAHLRDNDPPHTPQDDFTHRPRYPKENSQTPHSQGRTPPRAPANLPPNSSISNSDFQSALRSTFANSVQASQVQARWPWRRTYPRCCVAPAFL
jgi:hypothetical protein